MGAARPQSVRETIHRVLIDHLLAGTIRVQRLGHEQGQRVYRGIEPFSVRGEMVIDSLQQRGAGQQIEKIVGVQTTGIVTHAARLMAFDFMSNVHGS